MPTSSYRPAAKVPLLMLSGTLCDRRLLAPLRVRLPAGRVVLARDPVGAATVRDLAARALADAPPRFALLGFSLGGLVALEMAAQASERLAGLALIASNARPLSPEQHAARRGAVARARATGLAAFVEQDLWPSYVAIASRANSTMRRLVVDMAKVHGLDVYAAQVEAVIGRADSRPRLPELRMPVLALGGLEDAVCTEAMQREIAGLAPDATLAMVAGAGHMVPLEAPEAVTGHVATWLGRVDDVYWAGQDKQACREHA